MNSLPESQPLVLERTFNATVQQVWTAITQVDALRHWFFELAAFEPKVGFEFGFVGNCEGHKFVHQCRITEVVSERRLVFTWRYEGFEGESTVAYELFGEGDRTRMKLTHTGLHTFPAQQQFARENFAEGWTWLLGESLKKHLEGA